MTRVWLRRLLFLFLVSLAGLGSSAPALAREPAPQALPEVPAAALPKEARETLALVKRGGPFRYKQDGATFGNFEKRLPVRARGYYHEYTVPTPGARDRGARRIVAGGGEYYYTDDHYRSFRRIRE
ncbi:MAG TPA: ribonuclease domain-containing protein [Burkholderiales bacterium]|nr:ribonuclease domain-containing protein [Burkholderiales bacterium]